MDNREPQQECQGNRDEREIRVFPSKSRLLFLVVFFQSLIPAVNR